MPPTKIKRMNLLNLKLYHAKANAARLEINNAPNTEGAVMMSVFKKYLFILASVHALLKFSRWISLGGNQSPF